MNARIHALANRMNGNVVGIIGILTTVILTGAAGISALDLASFSSLDGPAASADLGKTLFALALLIGLVIVAPLVGALTLFTLLKRYSQQIGPLFHIAQAPTPSVVIGPYTASQAGSVASDLESLAMALERKRQMEDLSRQADAPTAPEPFDFGPSFEDVQRSKQSLANRQESAVLAQLFEANLSLHEKIELDNETEFGHEAATETNI